MDDFYDQEGNISLSALLSRPKSPSDDPRYLSPQLIEQIARFRLDQMRREQEANVAALKEWEAKRQRPT